MPPLGTRLGHIAWKRLQGLRDEEPLETSRLLSLSPKPKGCEFLLLNVTLVIGFLTGGSFFTVQARDE